MTERNLIALPLGCYELTDGKYNYTLEKRITKGDNPVSVFIIKMKGELPPSPMIFLLEDKFDVYDYRGAPDHLRGKFFRKGLTSITGLGGIAIYSKDTCRAIRDLRFVDMPYIYNRIPKPQPSQQA